MGNKNNYVSCDLNNRVLTMNNQTINLPPGELIIYSHYLTNKSSYCKFNEKSSCGNCVECFNSLIETSQSVAQLLTFYKQIYGPFSENYKNLKKKWRRGIPRPYPTLLQKISKINKNIKSQLNSGSDDFLITHVGGYGNKSYGIKLDKNMILIGGK